MQGPRITVALGAALFLSSCGFQNTVPSGSPAAEERQATPLYAAIPLEGVSDAQLDAQRAAGKTLPYFEGSIKSPLNGFTYKYKILGTTPSKSNGTTYLHYVPIMLVVHYPNGTVLDPTKPACGDSVSVEQRFLNGPNFVPTDLTSNGVFVGKTQLDDAFQRAEFWKVLKGPQYHVILQAARQPVVVHVNAPGSSNTVPGVCPGAGHRAGNIPFNGFFKIVHNVVEKYASPAQIPIVLTYNTFQVISSGFLVAGFHGSFKRSSGIQTYAVGTYADSTVEYLVPGIEDIDVITHEIGELVNDPFVKNQAPSWGDIPHHFRGCSTLLEVGDPLTAQAFDVKRDGFTYHPQELAFFSWFFRTPSIGTGGEYSFKGTFKTTQLLCT